MKKLSLLVLMCSVLFITSCERELFNCLTEEGDKEWREISLDAFHSVDFPGDSKVTFKQGEQNVMVYSTPNVIDALIEKGNVSNEVWHVEIANCARISTVEYIITLPTLEGVSISGSGEILTEGRLTNLNTLDLDVSGSASFDMELDTIQELNMKISGSGSFDMAGFAHAARIDVSGSGSVENFDLIAKNCNIDVSGSGSYEVHVLDQLTVDLSGSGTVCYKGAPTIDTNISGSGTLNNCN